MTSYLAYLNNSTRRLATHIVNGILIAKPIRAFNLWKKNEHIERSTETILLTVSYMCHRQSSSVIFYNQTSIETCVQ